MGTSFLAISTGSTCIGEAFVRPVTDECGQASARAHGGSTRRRGSKILWPGRATPHFIKPTGLGFERCRRGLAAPGPTRRRLDQAQPGPQRLQEITQLGQGLGSYFVTPRPGPVFLQEVHTDTAQQRRGRVLRSGVAVNHLKSLR